MRKFIALIKCHTYLLFYGMWKGQCMIVGKNTVAAVTGSMKTGVVVNKVFLTEDDQ